MSTAEISPSRVGADSPIEDLRCQVAALIADVFDPGLHVLGGGARGRDASVDQHSVWRDSAALVDAISGIEAVKNSLDALQAQYEVALRDQRIREQREAGLPRQKLGAGVGDEIALARGISPTRASRQLGLRRVIVETLPRTWERMAQGDVSAWSVEQVAGAVLVLDDQDRRQIDAELAPTLHDLSPFTAGRRARARADALDQEAAVARIRRNVAQRHVSQRPAADGMMRLSALVPLHEGVAAYASLCAAGDAARARGDQRSRGQVMADTFTTRLTGQPEAITPVEIQLLMTDRTLLAGGSDAAELEGHPIPGPVARHLALTGRMLPPQNTPAAPDCSAPDQTDSAAPKGHDINEPASHSDTNQAASQSDAKRWIRRLYADPVTGVLEAIDGRKRLFTGAVRRFVLARDRRCRTPGCEAAPRHIDHVERFSDGGSTTPNNAAAVCERFNYVTELPGWHTGIDPTTNTLRITAPTGHVYHSAVPSLWESVGLSSEGGVGLNSEPGRGAESPPGPSP